ncbi:thioredoxin-like protein [Phlegmacium glaucopus]|nr:thioredoxin-like protein [Phlegmacium glaucopus]
MVVTVINSLEDYNVITRDRSTVIIEFCAKWCGPSQTINPTFDKHSERYGNLAFYRVDIDNQPDIMQVADVKKIPMFSVFKEGKRLGFVQGADNRALANLLENHN